LLQVIIDPLIGAVPVRIGFIVSMVNVIPVELPHISVRTNVFTSSPVISVQLVYAIPLSIAPERYVHVKKTFTPVL
jgi:hypothetical protein